MPARPEWTKTQSRIIELLSDGQFHRTSEIRREAVDEYAETSTVSVHLSNIRAKLRPVGEDLQTRQIDGECAYRHIRVLSIAE